MCDRRDLNALRLTSKTFSNRGELTNRHWNLQGTRFPLQRTSPRDLERFSEDVKIVEGLELYLDYKELEDWPSSFRVLLKEHPELKNIFLDVSDFPHSQSLAIILKTVGCVLTRFRLESSSLTGIDDYLTPGNLPALEKVEFLRCDNLTVKIILHLLKAKLKQLTVNPCKISGEGLKELSNCQPLLLEKLHLIYCDEITEHDIINILKMSPNLKDLNLSSGTLITGEMFSELSIGYLHQLENLDLFDCSNITDLGLVKILRCCPELKRLVLEYSKIMGEMFSELSLGYLHQLENLNLSCCTNITDLGLVNILKCCPELKVLNFRDTSITGEMCSELSFGYLHKLENLNLSFCKNISYMGLIEILICCPGLKVLQFSNANISGEMFSELSSGYLHQLENLSLNGCGNITDLGLVKILRCCPELKVLELSLSNITGELFSELSLGYLHKLENLDLSDCSNITDLGIVKILSCCPELKVLNLMNTFITGEMSSGLGLGYLHKLENLDLDECWNITDLGLVKILRCCPELKVLKLEYSIITGEMFSELSLGYLHQLENLDLNYCSNITDLGLIKIIRCCPEMKVLDLGFTSITGEMFSELSLGYLHQLENLDLYCCSNITDLGIVKILRCCPELRGLKLYAPDITGEMLSKLSLGYLHKLDFLDLTCCTNISVIGLEKILKCCPELKVLVLEKITAEMFSKFSLNHVVDKELLRVETNMFSRERLYLTAK